MGKGVQRYCCKTCKKGFTATKGTIFYRCRHSEQEIAECMAMVGDRNSLAAIPRAIFKAFSANCLSQLLDRDQPTKGSDPCFAIS